MIKVLFVCHGNICRSPMAEFIFIDMLKKRHIKNVTVESRATSNEEIGNPVHYGTKRILNDLNIDCHLKRAEALKREDYNNWDYFVGMDQYNIKNMYHLFQKKDKVYLLMDFIYETRDVRDPWYTNDFETTYEDIRKGLEGFIIFLEQINGFIYE